jgi:hypothetical protein
MNFFKRKGALTYSTEAGEAAEDGRPSAIESVDAQSPEPAWQDEWDDAQKASEPAPIVEPDDAPDPTIETDHESSEPDASDELLSKADPEVTDKGAQPSPFEARLASLRKQLQEGPRLIPDIPDREKSEPPAHAEPDLPEPATTLAPEPATDAMAEEESLNLAPDVAPVLAGGNELQPVIASADAELSPVPIEPEPVIAPVPRRAGRVKTRLLGFERGASTSNDPLDSAAKAESSGRFPVGWIVVVKGPGLGASFCLYNGLSQIGRGSDQTVCLDFGDTSISRENHAVVAYDSEQKKHFLGHGGKANIVRLNDMPVLSTEELSHGDQIRIGETTLRFAALCGTDFDWSMSAKDDDFDAAAL